MKAINPLDYDKYIGKYIYKYQFFKTDRIYVNEPLLIEAPIDYYETEDLAKQRQAYEMYKMMKGTYKANNKDEGQASHFFKKYIDERDVDFFVSSISNNQMKEDEYFKYINIVGEEFPEKLI